MPPHEEKMSNAHSMPGEEEEGGGREIEWESLELTEPKVRNWVTRVTQFYRYKLPCVSV